MDQGWFNVQGNLVMPDQEHTSPQTNLTELPSEEYHGLDTNQPQAASNQALSGELAKALNTLQQGNKTALTRLPVVSVRALCDTLFSSSAAGSWGALNKGGLLKLLHQYVSMFSSQRLRD